jgi:hypothetical protein
VHMLPLCNLLPRSLPGCAMRMRLGLLLNHNLIALIPLLRRLLVVALAVLLCNAAARVFWCMQLVRVSTVALHRGERYWMKSCGCGW